jgi:hypothetical protein
MRVCSEASVAASDVHEIEFNQPAAILLEVPKLDVPKHPEALDDR